MSPTHRLIPTHADSCLRTSVNSTACGCFRIAPDYAGPRMPGGMLNSSIFQSTHADS